MWRQFGIGAWSGYLARLRIVVSTCLSLVLGAAALWGSGALTPHIRWGLEEFFLRAEVDRHGVLSADVTIELENEGLAPFTLTGISAEMPGLRFLPADAAKGEHTVVTVRSGGWETLRRRIVITDCAAVPREPQPIHFTYRTWMGSRSAEATWSSWRLTGSAGSLPVAWQRGLASKICNDAVSPEWP
jgi:hypothetical protein